MILSTISTFHFFIHMTMSSMMRLVISLDDDDIAIDVTVLK